MEPGQDVMARPATEAHLRGLPPRHTDVAEVVVSKTFSEALVALEAQLLYNPTAIHVLLTPGTRPGRQPAFEEWGAAGFSGFSLLFII